ncbi:hypothetical protein [Arthrobacter sp. zg-Y1110]|uniref:hypothetical protein n=1 Tax=Arthrobacter sp. zg-Y1110 TaxID=2886932 RepID=UPI001D142920|nr:hypothetical protein [Arthrobacter sp. zg-Y1110]MCC3290848.1 hypothetical protein [Arthrobacter sp. zg-Y1110]UWX86263.1 hypothetical protein N2K99_07035 [Arthrobacter sp. zg-Y1110]
MRADWVAATVRARSMAQRRVGAGTCRELSALPDLPAAVEALEGSVYADQLAGTRTLGAAQQATRRTVLWQLRVLAGWLPAGQDTQLVRAAAARYEADNIVALAAALRRNTGTGAGLEPGADSAPVFDLGGLATAWPRLQTADSPETLQAMLAASPWGDPGPAVSLPDMLTAVWLRRLASAAPATRPWAVAGAVLLAARLLLVTGTGTTDRLVSLLRPLIGTRWTEAASLPELTAALSPAAGQVLGEVQEPQELWRAEARLAAQVETDGFGLLRAGLPGPDVIVGAMAVLAADAWRVRAALAAAAAGTGRSEVLDAVA